jgi:hypothetical protein
MSIFESFMRGQQLAQQENMQRMQLAQMQSLEPLQRQLQELELERAKQQIAAGSLANQEALKKTQRESQVFAGRLAEQALSIEDPEIRSTFLQGAAQKLGLGNAINPDSVTDDDLYQIVAAGKALQPEGTAKLGRYQASVIGNKVHVIDSVTGQSKVENLGVDTFRPPNMSDDDYEIYRNLSPKDQTKLLEKQLDPKIVAEQEDRRNKIKTAEDLRITALDLTNNILEKQKLFPEVLGPLQGRVDFRLNDDEADLINDINELSDILLSDKLKLMSGVLSESDIKILQRIASGGLNRASSQERFMNRLLDVQNAFKGSEKDSLVQDQKRARLEQLRKEAGL